jgi:hypothetical protein
MDFTPNISYNYGEEYIFGIPFNKSYQLLCRTTRTINGVTEDVWANTQKMYRNGQQFPRHINLRDIEFGVMKPNKEIVFNTFNQDMTLPKKNYTHFIIKGIAIPNGEWHILSTPQDIARWSAFELKHLRHNRTIQESFPHTMNRLKTTIGLDGRTLWSNLCNYTVRTARDITASQSCESVSRELSRPRYYNSFKLPRMAKTIQFETVQYEVSARKGRRNVLGTPRVKGQSRISPVFNYPLSNGRIYTLNWTALRHATV